MNHDEAGSALGREANDGGQWLELIRQHVATLRFGTVQITVHDGKVVQLERNEKVRLATGQQGLARYREA
jgi:hypothetical protein